MPVDRSQPLREITFVCRDCHFTYKVTPGRVVDAPDLEYHPYEYFADCPECGQECAQAYWEKNLIKAYSKATGPTTPEGIAAAAKNLEGHPTAEEAKRTRFNAMKHGLFARTATYFPAKPDGYAACAKCEIDRTWCAAQPACTKQTQNFMLHHAAFEQGNPKHLSSLYADMHAAVFAVMQQILQTLIADGVKIERPVFHFDADGGFHLANYVNEHGEAKQIIEISAHPLLKPLSDLISRNRLSLADLGITSAPEADDDVIMGQLKTGGQSDLNDYQRQTIKTLQDLREKIDRSRQKADNDPILVEYQRENGAG